LPLSAYDKLHMMHRCWRLRFKSEVPSIRYVRTANLAGATVLDIGANKGVFSIYLSRAAGPAGRLIAFEAQPELGQHLEDVRSAFGLANMTLVNQGLSSSPGVLTMHRPAAGSGMASFEFGAADNGETLDVPVITLDDYVAEHDVGTISFIKCDVEGHELHVFRGGASVLASDHPALLFECHDSEAADGRLFDFLEDLGYDGHFFFVSPEDHASLWHKGRGYFVPCRRHAEFEHVHPGVQHRNYLFVKRGSRP